MGCDILTNHSCLNLLDLFTELRNLKDGLDAYISILNLILGDKAQDIYFGNQIVLLPESDLVNFADQVKYPNKIYIIRDDYNLGGSKINIPENCTLKFEGGKIYNGSIVGNNTHIISDTDKIMTNISVSGTFNNDTVYSNWIDYTLPDSDQLKLQNALNLCNGETLTKLFVACDNYIITIFPDEGEDDKDGNNNYIIKHDKYGECENLNRGGLTIPSNTDVDFQNSTLKVDNSAHNYSRYNLIQIFDDNISLKNGNLIGDIYEHTKAVNSKNNNALEWGGEWGFGVAIKGGKNIILDNIHTSLFWGDGLYIGDVALNTINGKDPSTLVNPDNRDIDIILPENILIKNCISDYNRRQGLSVIAVRGLRIYDSKFIYTGYAEPDDNPDHNTNDDKWRYTAPGAGIDFEQNWHYKSDIADIIIDGCEFTGNKKGIVVNDKLELENYVRTKDVTIKDCIIDGTTQVKIKRDTNFKFLNCTFDGWIQHGDGDVTFDNCTFNGHWHIIRGTTKLPERDCTININFCRFNLSSFYSDRCVFRVSELVGTKSLRLVGCVFDVNNMPDPTKGNNINFPLVKVSSKSNKVINFDNLDLRLLNCTFQCSDNTRNFSYFGWDIWASNAIIGCTINECKKVTIYRRTTGVNDLDEPITDYSFKLKENIIRFKRQVDYKPATGGDNNSNDNSPENPIIPNPEDGDESINNEETNGGNESGDNENTGGDENPPHSETEEESGENGGIGSDINNDGEGNDNQQDPQPEVIPDPYFYCEGNVKRGTDKRDIIITDNIFFFDAKEAPLWKMPNYEEGLNKMTLVMKRNISVGKVISGRSVLSRITGDGIITDQESGIERFSIGDTFNYSTDNAFNYLSDERSDADSNFIILSDLQDLIDENPDYGFTGLQAIDLKTGVLTFHNGTSWVDCMGQKFGLHQGVTSKRPKNLGVNDAGYQFFDTKTKDSLTWNGTGWVINNPIQRVYENGKDVTFTDNEGLKSAKILTINKVEATIDGVEQDVEVQEENSEPHVYPSIEENLYGKTLKLAFENLKGEEGRGIQNITATPTNSGTLVIITYTDTTTVQFTIPNGETGIQGPQGDSIYVDNIDNPLLILANSLGNSNKKAISQKAVTDTYINTNVGKWELKDSDIVSGVIYNNSGTIISAPTNASFKTAYTFVTIGEIIKVSVTGSLAVEGLGICIDDDIPSYRPDNPPSLIFGSNEQNFEYTFYVELSGYLWVGLRGQNCVARIYSAVSVNDIFSENINELSNSVENISTNVDNIIETIGSEIDHTNICDPSLSTPYNYGNNGDSIGDSASWSHIPIIVEPGKTYYTYYNGERASLGNGAKRAFDNTSVMVKEELGNKSSIAIPTSAVAPVRLYINYRNENSSSPLDPNKIMVSLRSDLTKHYEYGAKVYGSNLPQVDPLDHTPTLKEDPLAEIISHPSRARLFPIWGVIGGSFETGYTNGKKRTTDEEKTFYDNSNRSAVPVTNGWGYEWPTLFGELNHVTVGDYAIEGHSFYRWLQKLKTTNPTNFGNDGKHFQAFIINMSGNEIGSRGDNSSDKYPSTFKYGNVSEINWNNNYDNFSPAYTGNGEYVLENMTYCEMIAAMVKSIWKIEPECHIFFVTLRKDSTRTGELLTKANDMVRVFKDMLKITPNSHLINLYEHGIDWGDETVKERYIRGSHPTRLGHIYLCDEFNTYIDWIIGKNPELFRDAAYIGTNYKL